MTNVTQGATTPDTVRNFQRILTKETGKGKAKVTTTQVIGPGSKAFRELLGEVDDARQSIFNGVGLLSTIAKRSELIDSILKTNDDAIANKTTQLFYSDKNEAIKWFKWGYNNCYNVFSWPSLPEEIICKNRRAIKRWELLVCFDTSQKP